jgi:type II secretory pathway pseudopilin PulG
MQIMVAVAVLGIAASIGIPRYMKSLFAERQAECPRELRKIVAAENEFHQQHQRYTANLIELDWKAPIKSYYLYGFSDTPSEQTATEKITRAGTDSLQSADLPETFFSANAFRIGCAGNIDTDRKLDRVTIDEKGVLVHIDNDLE